MKIATFKIPLLKWDVKICHSVSKNEIEKMKKIASDFGLPKIQEIDTEYYSGMHHFWGGKSFIWTVNQKNKLSNEKILRHELRHLEDRILQHYEVKDIEMAAILSEFIEEQIYNLKQEKK